MSFDADLRDVVEAPQAPRRASPPSDRVGATPEVTSPSAVRAGTRHPFVKAFTCAGVVYLLATTALLVVVAYQALPRATSHEFGDAIAGAMLLFSLPSIVPAVVTGLIVSQSSRVWTMPWIALVFLPMFLLILALQLFGAVSG